MVDSRINYNLIRDSYGCDNCKHDDDGMWDDYCGLCTMDYCPPSKYRPARYTIQEKLWYDRGEEITYAEYLRFLSS